MASVENALKREDIFFTRRWPGEIVKNLQVAEVVPVPPLAEFAMSLLLEREIDRAFTGVRYWLLEIKSPIEQMLWLALWVLSQDHGYQFQTCFPNDPGTREGYNGVAVTPQKPVGRFRSDFQVVYYERGAYFPGGLFETSVCVECDGHDFHERTKEQAEHDRKRDRYFQTEGIPLLRFTGSEIWKDVMGCAQQTLDFLKQQAIRADAAARKAHGVE